MTAKHSLAPDVPVETLVDPRTRPCAGAVIQDGYDVDTHWHAHDMHQLQYAFEGAIAVEDRHRRHLLPRQLAAWIPAGVAHRTRLHKVRSGSVLLAPSMIADAGDRVRIVAVPPLMRQMVIGAMRWPLAGALDRTGQAYFEALACLLGEWIAEEAALWLPTSSDPRIEAATAHIRANTAEAGLASTCAAVGMSERSLRRHFSRQLGMGWDDYARRARLIRAVALLGDTDQPIGTIAAMVGFESQSAFAKAFRALLGRSPREFRRDGAL